VTRPYRKPLAGGGSRIIDRAGSGRFARVSLGCETCPECGTGLLVPQYKDLGGFVQKVMPERCDGCQRRR
jgi:hypothetical protein